MAAHGGPYDVTLDFGFRPDQETEPVYDARVSMSWEHAMSVVKILERLIREYEKQIPSLGAMRQKLDEAELEATPGSEQP